MAVIIQWRRDTAANWTSADPTLATGEVGYETDTDKLKIGDGVTAWTALSYHQGDADALHDNVDGEISAIAEKTAPSGADLLVIEDSAASNAKKRVRKDNLFMQRSSVTVVDVTATDDPTLFFTSVAITVSAVHSHITAGTNVVFNVGHAATRTGSQLDVFSSDITLTSTAGQTDSSGFDDATIPANSWVWIDVVSVSGSVTHFHVTVEYTED